jgi:hypothetical protein
VVGEDDEVQTGKRRGGGDRLGAAAAIRAGRVQMQRAGRSAGIPGTGGKRDPRWRKKEENRRCRGESSDPETN